MKVTMTRYLTLIAIFFILIAALLMQYQQNKLIDEINTQTKLIPTAAGGTNYYVCDDGNDTNSGMTESAPFQSFSKAIDTFNTMNAGDSVLFCHGGVFAISDKKIYNSRCSATSVCTLGSYGDTLKEKPQLVADSTAGLNFQDSGDADADGGYVVENLILMSSTNTSAGIVFYNDVNDVLLSNLHIQGFNVGVYLAGFGTLKTGVNGANDRVILQDSVIVNNKAQGFLGGGNDVQIINNHFENNGFGTANLDHNIYIDSPSKNLGFSVKNIKVQGNTLYKSTHIDGKCQGVSLVVHGIVSDLTIESNIIKEDVGAVAASCWGIGIDPGNPVDEVFTNVIIRNNKLINVGNTAIECSSCNGALIENNVIIDDGDVLKLGIVVPGKPEDTVKSNNVRILNNQIIVNRNDASGMRIGGLHPFEVHGNTIKQPETVDADCIVRLDANLETDISTNSCSSFQEVVYIDAATGEEIDSSVSNITDLTLTTTTTSTSTTETRPTDVVISETTTTDTTSTSSGTRDVAVADTTTDTTTTDTTTTDTTTSDGLSLTTLDDYTKAKGKGKTSTNKPCRATSSTGECLMQ